MRLTRTLPNTRICPGAATPASNLAQRNSTKELEAHYKAQLDGLMKQRQERRWKARAELSARREARVEELRQEPGAEVPESEEDFRQRMQRNFLEGDVRSAATAKKKVCRSPAQLSVLGTTHYWSLSRRARRVAAVP